jgi:hypothetical protein
LAMRELLPAPRGRLRLWQNQQPGEWLDNLVLYNWATVMGKLLIDGLPHWRIQYLYLEFENVANPTTPVTLPTFGRTPADGWPYYQGLSTSTNRDFLRLPVLVRQLTSDDTSKYPQGNIATFLAQSAGLEGFHGKPFNDTVNSKVFGAALVVSPEPLDPTQDLVFSRAYFPASQQMVKTASSQIGVEWSLRFD